MRSGGLVTRPALRQEVHTSARRVRPFSQTRTRCTLGRHFRLERLWLKLTWWLNWVRLSQYSQTAAMAQVLVVVSVARAPGGVAAVGRARQRSAWRSDGAA